MPDTSEKMETLDNWHNLPLRYTIDDSYLPSDGVRDPSGDACDRLAAEEERLRDWE